MPRTLNESIQVLENSRDEIKTALNAKLSIESGGVVDPLKISEVAGYIDQIETGGSGNKATVTFSVGEGNVGDFSISESYPDHIPYLDHSGEIRGKCVLEINVENSPFDMDNNAVQYSMLMKEIDLHYGNKVEGEIKNGSGTITITVENGFSYASEGYFEPFLILMLRDSVEDFRNCEIHTLFAKNYT